MSRISANSDPFRAIADPGRRRILDALLEREHAVGELTQLLGVSQPTVSQHLKVLKSAGLVADRAEGRHRLYHAEPAALADVADWLGKYERFWKGRFAALAAHLSRRKQ